MSSQIAVGEGRRTRESTGAASAADSASAFKPSPDSPTSRHGSPRSLLSSPRSLLSSPRSVFDGHALDSDIEGRDGSYTRVSARRTHRKGGKRDAKMDRDLKAAELEEEERRLFGDVVAMVLDSGRTTWIQWILLVTAVMTYGHFSTQQMIVTISTLSIRETWPNIEPLVFNTVHSVAAFARLFGSLILIPFADHYGRLPVIIGSLTISSVFALSTSFVPNFGSYTALRFLVIFLTSTLPSLSVVYIIELQKKRFRSQASILCQIGGSVLLCYMIGVNMLLGSNDSISVTNRWRVLQSLVLLPGLVALANFVIFRVETPGFLQYSGQFNRGLKALRRLRPHSTVIPESFPPPVPVPYSPQTLTNSPYTISDTLSPTASHRASHIVTTELAPRISVAEVPSRPSHTPSHTPSHRPGHRTSYDLEPSGQNRESDMIVRSISRVSHLSGVSVAEEGPGKGNAIKTALARLAALFQQPRRTGTICLIATWAFQSFTHWGISSFLTLFYKRLEVDVNLTSLITYAVQIPGHVLCFFLVKVLGFQRTLFYLMLASGIPPLILGCLLVKKEPSELSSKGLAALAVLTLDMGAIIWGPLYAFSAQLYHPNMRATAMACFAVTNALATVVTTYVGTLTIDSQRSLYLTPIIWATLRLATIIPLIPLMRKQLSPSFLASN